MEKVIAIVWDFDKTLIDGYMQDPIFKKFGVDAAKFWDNKEAEVSRYGAQGMRVNRDTYYLNIFIREAQKGGMFDGLNNAMLRVFGKKQDFYAGIPEFFERTKSLGKELGVDVEHYIVSTGFAEVIRGTSLMNYVSDIWGCELIERDGRISVIGYSLDNTTKTRALFEINKGPVVDVNKRMSNEERRVDFKNIIYIADGQSDVPAFSVTKDKGGSTFGVYPEGDERALAQVEGLKSDGRIDSYAVADYREGSPADMWICNKIKELAERIKNEEKAKKCVGGVPKHLE